MNAHIPQSYEATAELQEIAAVPMQIIRPRDSTPVIGVVQDALAGSYLATRPGNYFTRREFMNMMMKNKAFQGLTDPRGQDPLGKQRYTGQQIIETLFAPLNMNMKNSSWDSDKSDYNNIIIKEGKFLQGVLDKGIFNKASKGIVHTTYNDYGPKKAVELMDGLQNMMETYLIMKGFSVGISDLIADEDTRKRMEETITEKKKELDDLLLQVHMDLFTNNSGKSNQEEFETRAITILNKATGDSGKVGVDSLPDNNRLMVMVRSGSKGDKTNVAQMIACVGQQAPEGKRIPYGFTERTLPHYKMFDDGAEARGFVEGSFLRGLTPQEFFFHAMSGREGLIDTAVKTAETGYTQRQLIKAMEDLMTHHDGTVRDAAGRIYQFHYGEDGINSTKLESTSLGLDNLDKMTEAQILSTYAMKDDSLTGVLEPTIVRGDDKKELDEFANEVAKDRAMMIEKVFHLGRVGSLTASVNLERLLSNIVIKFNLDKTKPTNLTPLQVVQDIQTLIDRTQPYNKIWCACLRYHLAPHKIVKEQRFTKEAWQSIVEAILTKNWKSWAVPGELVGVVAAQSIGEPATQMTLNTFHQAGVAAKSAMTRGVPRLKELLKVTKNPKATSLTVYLKPEFRSDKDAVREVAQDLELTLLKDIVSKAAIYYDPEDEETVVEEDRDLIKFFKELELRNEFGACGEEEGSISQPTNFSKWMIRFVFDREKMFNKNITMDDVYFVIQTAYAGYGSRDEGIHTIYSDYNSSKLIMRIRPKLDEASYGDSLGTIKHLQNELLNNVIIRGVSGIRAVNWRQDTSFMEKQMDGTYKAINQYIMDTDGSNYIAVMNHPAVDGNKLYSTNVHDIYEQLGIEATQSVLYSEISGLFDEADINYRHLGLLCDTMTHGGRLMSVDRYGINKLDNGPLAKACFEETEKILLKAALYGELDPVTGVSANIMTGQPIRGGTAFTQVLLDEQALVKMMEDVEVAEDEEREEELDQETINQVLYGAEEDKCAQIQTQMNLILPKVATTNEDTDDEIELVEI